MGFANLDVSRHPGFLSAQRYYENMEPSDVPVKEKTLREKIDCTSLSKLATIKKILLKRLEYENVNYLLECVEDACNDKNKWNDFLKEEIEPILSYK